MSRRTAYTIVVVLLALALAAGGAEAKPSLRRLAHDHTAFLGQHGHRTTLRRIGHSRRYRLTLHGVGERLAVYHDHSPRRGPTFDTGKALRQVFHDGPQLGAIEVPGAPAAHDSMAAKLSEPSYDRDTGTVSYVAEPMPKAPGSGITPNGLEADESLPPTLGDTNVYMGISNLGGLSNLGYWCEVEVSGRDGQEGGEEWAGEWKVEETFKAKTDEWWVEPWRKEYNLETRAVWVWSTHGSADVEGCANAVVFGYDGNIPTEGKHPELAIVTIWTGGQPQTECRNPFGEWWSFCETDGSSTHGLFDSDLIARFAVEPGKATIEG
jgi:hypothetical protein